MSGVYAPKMDIPKNCIVCPYNRGLSNVEQSPSVLCGYTQKPIPLESVPHDRRLDCCELREIGPHGDLIDRAKLAKTAEKRHGILNIGHIDAAPTVIPADM